jgi:hypothetical protein
MRLKALFCTAALAAAALPGVAGAFVLDTGTPNNVGFPLSLDGTDFYAAEFSLGANSKITSIQGYITGGDSGLSGDTFTVALYSASGPFGLTSHNATPVWTGQATFQGDGWNGLSNLSVTGLAAGNYWAAFEVGASDSTLGLFMPIEAVGGSKPALGFAFNSGAGYQAMTDGFGAQVSAVPLPGALLLLMSGVAGLGGFTRRRAATAA